MAQKIIDLDCLGIYNNKIHDELDKKVNKTTKINNHTLSSNITITKSDVELGSVENKPMDSTPTSGSDNYVSSGGVKDYVDASAGAISHIQINGVEQAIVNKTVNLPAYPTKTSLGLNNVDNTSDANKPISSLTQSALNLKVNLADLVIEESFFGGLY